MNRMLKIVFPLCVASCAGYAHAENQTTIVIHGSVTSGNSCNISAPATITIKPVGAMDIKYDASDSYLNTYGTSFTWSVTGCDAANFNTVNVSVQGQSSSRQGILANTQSEGYAENVGMEFFTGEQAGYTALPLWTGHTANYSGYFDSVAGVLTVAPVLVSQERQATAGMIGAPITLHAAYL